MVIGDPNKVIGISKVIRISAVYIYGCRHSIFFADGSHSEKPAPLAFLIARTHSHPPPAISSPARVQLHPPAGSLALQWGLGWWTLDGPRNACRGGVCAECQPHAWVCVEADYSERGVQWR